MVRRQDKGTGMGHRMSGRTLFSYKLNTNIFFSFTVQDRVPINSFTYATSVIDRSLKTFVVEMSNDIRFVTNLYAAFYLINK